MSTIDKKDKAAGSKTMDERAAELAKEEEP